MTDVGSINNQLLSRSVVAKIISMVKNAKE